MASINYLSGTVIPSTWLNDVDAVVWDIFGGASTVLGARSALGLGTADSPAFAGADIGDMGTEGSGINIGGTVYNSTFKVSDIDGTNYAQTILHRHSTTLEPLIVSARSNSNTSAHADMAAGQSVFSIYGTGWAGSNYKIFSSVELGVDATGTISNTSAPGRITFKVTPDGSTTPATALSIANNKSVTFAGLQTLAAGADIASATTVDLTAATGNLVRVTGTTPTTGFTINNGQVVLCYPTGAWPLTYHATNMPIKGGVSYTCAAGDTVIFTKDGNGTLHVDIFKADGTALVGSSAIYGQCRLTNAGSNLKLSPFNGNQLTINGVAYAIPDAGVELVPTGTADDVFYIYAYMNAGTMTLEASTTAHATSTTAGNKGNKIKSGDDTRTLVGMAYNASDTWSTTLTWHNRRTQTGRSWLTANRTTTSTTIAEINTEARVYFLTWADEAVLANANGTASNSNAFQTTNMAIGWDGVSVYGGVSKQANTTATSVNSLSATSVAAVGQLTERALHYCVLGGSVSANTGTFYGGADNADRTEMNVTTRG